MKKGIPAIIICVAFILSSCIKDEYPAKGVLVGIDMRLCVCCGGYYMNLNNVDTINGNTKVAGTLPADFSFTPDELPLKVQFAWQQGGTCLSNSITVTKIKRR